MTIPKTLTPAMKKQRRAVQCATQKAQRKGLLVPEPCLFCGALQVQMHHHDYSLPLEVTWLCPQHHMLVHGRTWLAPAGSVHLSAQKARV